MLKKQVPNIITLLNLLSGCVGVIMAMQNNLVAAAIFVGLGIFFDFFDGLAARSLKVQSELGLQLDSLADMVTSGLVPGIAMFQLLKRSISYETSIPKDWNSPGVFDINFPVFALIGLLITLGSAYRLAKFNIDDRQTSSFIGLPTPAAAIFIASLPIISKYYNILFTDSKFFIGISIILSLLLVANLPLFSLKIKKGENWKNKENIIRIIFLISCVILLFIFEFAAIPFIVILYIFLSILNNLIK